jgi:D-3-phosphoglycerate dehydrogenase / 2-oxoglutarate reductase
VSDGPHKDLRVLICEQIADAGVALLGEKFTVESGVGWSKEDTLARLPDFDAIVVRSATKVTAAFMEASDRLKVVGRAGTGVDNVDVEAATRRGVIVCNAAGSNALSAAEHAVALLMAQARNVAQAHAALVQGRWERSKYGGIEIDGKTLGVLGFGRIGQMVAERCKGLGMHVVAYDPFVADQRYKDLGVERAETPDDLYGVSDFISLHLASTPETKGFVGAAAFAAMKPGCRIINAARGDVIDTAALVAALESGHLGGAGIDVFPEEPCTDSPLFGMPGVVVTPHLGASTAEAQDRAGVAVAEQVAAALTGGVVTSAVNIPAVAPEALEVLGPFLPLAVKMGELLGQLTGGRVSPLEIGYQGEIAALDTRLLTSSVITGVLAGHTEQPVNMVNAASIAAERGIEWVETSTSKTGDYRNVLSLTSGPVSISGTTVGTSSRPRLVEILGHDIEIEMAPLMAIFRYGDVPGMIGRVGTILGEENINVASMAVSRANGKAAGKALMALTVDAPIPDASRTRIAETPTFDDAWFVELKS